MGRKARKAALRNEQIDQEIRLERIRMKAEVKVLIYGGLRDSGMQGILKNFKLIYGEGFTQVEREKHRDGIHAIVKDSMLRTLRWMDYSDISLEPHLQTERKKLEEGWGFVNFQAVAWLWENAGVKESFARAHAENRLPDCAPFLFEHLKRISAPDYVPTDQDVLMCPVRSQGVTETRFRLNDVNYIFVDPNQNRGDQRKWIRSFEGVQAICFVVNLALFDSASYDGEIEIPNCLMHDIELFDYRCNLRCFEKTPVILILNHVDKLREKLKKARVADYFPDYDGPNECDPVVDFFQNRFRSLDRSGRNIYTHITFPSDPDQVRFILAYIKDIIIQADLRSSGLL